MTELAALLPELLPRDEVVDPSSSRPLAMVFVLYLAGLVIGPSFLWSS